MVLVDRRVEVALAREELDGRLDLAEVQAEARRDAVRVAALVARAVLRVVVQDPLARASCRRRRRRRRRGLAVRLGWKPAMESRLGAAAAPEETWIFPSFGVDVDASQ